MNYKIATLALTKFLGAFFSLPPSAKRKALARHRRIEIRRELAIS